MSIILTSEDHKFFRDLKISDDELFPLPTPPAPVPAYQEPLDSIEQHATDGASVPFAQFDIVCQGLISARIYTEGLECVVRTLRKERDIAVNELADLRLSRCRALSNEVKAQCESVRWKRSFFIAVALAGALFVWSLYQTYRFSGS